MIAATIREARRGTRDGAFVVTVLAYGVSLLFGGYQSIVRVEAQRAQAGVSTADMATRWEALRREAGRTDRTWSDARSASLVGSSSGHAVIVLPIDRLAVLSAGESRREPIVRRISLYADEPEPPLENPLAAAGGLFDLAFVVIWLLPLAIVAACHGVVSGDRQAGIWPLVAASTDAPGVVVAARLAWPVLVLTGMTVGVAVACVWSNGAPAGVDEPVRLLLWTAGAVLYALFWAAIAGVATMRLAGSAPAMLTLGLAWLSIVWLIPGVIDAAALWRHPAVSRFDADLAARELDRDPEEMLPVLLEEVYAEHPEWRPSPERVAAARRPIPGGPASRDSRRVYVPARAAARATDEHRAHIERWRAELGHFVDRAAVLTPALLWQRFGDEISGLSPDRFSRFKASTAGAESAWRAFFEPRIMKLEDLSPDDLAAVPLPAAVSPEAGPRPWGTGLWLFGWAAAAAAAAVTASRRLTG